MNKIRQNDSGDTVEKARNRRDQSAEHDARKLRPRRPISIAPGDLPDNALIDKHTRNAVSGLGDSRTYELVKEGRFPPPVKLGPRCVRTRMGDLRRWLADPLGYRAP